MADTQSLIKMLQSNNPNKRYDACEELRVSPSLSPDALEALQLVTNDTNPDVADAAQRALALHNEMKKELGVNVQNPEKIELLLYNSASEKFLDGRSWVMINVVFWVVIGLVLWIPSELIYIRSCVITIGEGNKVTEKPCYSPEETSGKGLINNIAANIGSPVVIFALSGLVSGATQWQLLRKKIVKTTSPMLVATISSIVGALSLAGFWFWFSFDSDFQGSSWLVILCLQLGLLPPLISFITSFVLVSVLDRSPKIEAG